MKSQLIITILCTSLLAQNISAMTFREIMDQFTIVDLKNIVENLHIDIKNHPVGGTAGEINPSIQSFASLLEQAEKQIAKMVETSYGADAAKVAHQKITDLVKKIKAFEKLAKDEHKYYSPDEMAKQLGIPVELFNVIRELGDLHHVLWYTLSNFVCGLIGKINP